MGNSLLRAETYVSGVKVDSAKKGDNVEFRIVFTTDGGDVQFVTQRRNTKQYPQTSSPIFNGDAGVGYYSINWAEIDDPATYYIKCALFVNGSQADWKEFPYVVRSGTTPPPTSLWDTINQAVNQIPGGWYTVAGAGGVIGVLAIVGVVSQQEEKKSLMMMMFGRRR